MHELSAGWLDFAAALAAGAEIVGQSYQARPQNHLKSHKLGLGVGLVVKM